METTTGAAASKNLSRTITKKSGKEFFLESTVATMVVVIPAIGVVISPFWILRFGLTMIDATLFFSFYILTVVGIAVGYHRYFTHRSFESNKGFKVFLAVAGEMAMQGPVIRWVADHRRHHSFADVVGDPHSPYTPVKTFLGGFWHAHTGWMFDAEKTIIRKYAPDLMCDQTIVKIDKLYFLWSAVSLFLPAIIGLILTQSWQGGFSAFLFGSLVRVFVMNQVTWAVNSFGHCFGDRPHELKDKSTNVWWLSVASFGEGWHNNHHAYPTYANHGHGWRQIDLGWMVILAANKLGLVWNVKSGTSKKNKNEQ